MNNMRKEIVMSEQEFNSLKNNIETVLNILEDEGKNDALTSNGWYVLGLLNVAHDLLTWGMKE